MREKKAVNYNNMLAGTGQISDSMDYGEVSGTNSRLNMKKMGGNFNNMGMQMMGQTPPG